MSSPDPLAHLAPERLVVLDTAHLAGLISDAISNSRERRRSAQRFIGVVVLFVQIGALSPETQYPCGFPAGATLAR